jgi:flagellar L-ring protein FlgH
MPIKRSNLVAIAAVATFVIAPADARKPPIGFEAPPPLPLAPPPPEDGGIFHASSGYAALHEGRRARAVGDTLTIYIAERTVAGKDASSQSARNGSFSILPPSAGLFSFLNPNALKASGGSSFKGQGNAAQSSNLVGQVGVTIVEARANGTALVKGEKRMLLSQGQEWVQFSGIVRLADIDADNGIQSSRVADARIEYSGNGAVQRAGREGWLSRFFNTVSPF